MTCDRTMYDNPAARMTAATLYPIVRPVVADLPGPPEIIDNPNGAVDRLYRSITLAPSTGQPSGLRRRLAVLLPAKSADVPWRSA